MKPPGPTLVQAKETTVQHPLPLSYHDYRNSQDPQASEQASQLYERLDLRDGSCKLDTLASCRTDAWFAFNQDTREIRILSNACRLRWCPMCQAATRSVIAKNSAAWYKTIIRPKFLTLTLLHSDRPLEEQLRRLVECYRKFRRRRIVHSKTRGGIWFFQIKRSPKTGQWHPHIHVLLDMDYIPQKALCDLWQSVTGDSFVVDIRAVHKADNAINYVSRYAGNPCNLQDLSPDDQLIVFDALHGKRICGTYGSAKCVKLRAERPDDSGTWKYLESWRIVVSHVRTDTLSKAIWKAYSIGSPIDNPTILKLIEQKLYTPPPTVSPDSIVTDTQSSFAGYLSQ